MKWHSHERFVDICTAIYLSEKTQHDGYSTKYCILYRCMCMLSCSVRGSCLLYAQPVWQCHCWLFRSFLSLHSSPDSLTCQFDLFTDSCSWLTGHHSHRRFSVVTHMFIISYCNTCFLFFSHSDNQTTWVLFAVAPKAFMLIFGIAVAAQVRDVPSNCKYKTTPCFVLM